MISAETKSSGSTVRKSHNARGQSWTGVEIVRQILDGYWFSSNKGMPDFEGVHLLQEADPFFH